ncbi:MAG: AAA family ATPase [Janthinobacterium lividum]
MITQLQVQDFTILHQATFDFVPGLNAIIGSNGAGKSHVLKLAYSVAQASYEVGNGTAQNKQIWRNTLAERLLGVFRPEALGRLTRRAQGRSRAEVRLTLAAGPDTTVDFDFSTASKTEVNLRSTPGKYAAIAPVFIPTKEVLSLFPGLRGLYTEREIAIDETYPALCERLDRPMLKGPRLELVKKMLPALEDMMGGSVKLENGRFYLYPHQGGQMEIDLVAEGIRKIALLAYLLGNGSLSGKTTLFWDEPEANLNPLLIEKLAPVLCDIADSGIQVILATHSLYLLRELDLLNKERGTQARFFSLGRAENTLPDTDSVATSPQLLLDQADDLEKLNPIPALDAEIAQTDRYMQWLNSHAHA